MQSLNLGGNPLGREQAVLGRAVAQSSSLTSLNVDKTQQSGEGLGALVDGLRSGPRQLVELHLQRNGIDELALRAVAQPLLVGLGLRDLFLGNNAIGVGGCAALAAHLHESTLRRLNLMHNALGDGAAGVLAEALPDNRSLERLNLSHNKIGDEGMAALARGVARNVCLRNLDVGVNPASPGSLAPLREAMSAASVQKRQCDAFRPVAWLLLLASHASSPAVLPELQLAADGGERAESEDAALAPDLDCLSASAAGFSRLPHGIVCHILELAAPSGFF